MVVWSQYWKISTIRGVTIPLYSASMIDSRHMRAPMGRQYAKPLSLWWPWWQQEYVPFPFWNCQTNFDLISSFMPRCVSGVPALINVKTFQQTRVLMHILLMLVPSIIFRKSRSMPFESWCKTSTPKHSWRRCCFHEWLLSPYWVLTCLFCSSSGNIQIAELEMNELDGWSTSVSKNKHDIIPCSQAQVVLPYTPVRMTPFSFIAVVIPCRSFPTRS